LVEQLEQQKRFLKIDADNVTGGLTASLPPDIAQMNRTHRQNLIDLVQELSDNYTISKPDNFTKTIGLAAQWVDAHLPAHDTGELEANKLEGGAKAAYSWGSSFVHGYKWSIDYFPGVKLFQMIADSLATTVFMTECAVALYEASCRRPAGGQKGEQSYVPERLEPTIAAWSTDLFAT
jgi:hypothetical protein